MATGVVGGLIKEERMSPNTEQLESLRVGATGFSQTAASSRAPVPAVLARSRREELLRQFVDQFEPIGPTEMVLVRDLARHAARAECWDEGGGAVERQAARRLPELATGLAPDEMDDAVLSAAMTATAAESCDRQCLSHSRAFQRTLDKLEAIQSARRDRERRGGVMPPSDFVDEAACEVHLAERWRRGLVLCPKCGGADGCVITSRNCWECGRCKSQIGLRFGTVAARSALPLRQWFDAIRVLLWRPTIGIKELAAQIGVRRLTTVRAMARRIRQAMSADDASARLAGLDRHFERAADDLSEARGEKSVSRVDPRER